ncbi:MAG: zinc ABC transporter substrate-binding protein [Pseudomonadota bacterium]|nr:zinc ABC transporter substrate-binding protein [Pseudomonadota bacterium]
MKRIAVCIWILAVCLAFPARAEGLKVVASIKPVHSLVASVMAGAGEPYLLVRGAASPHDYTLKPADAAALAGADTVFWMGPALETFLVHPLETLAGRAQVVTLLSPDVLEVLPVRAGGVWGDHHHDHGEDEPEALDPHAWLDANNAIRIVRLAEKVLSEKDPDNAALYRRNARDTEARLKTLRGDISSLLGSVRDRPFIVSHDAFQYMEQVWGLKGAGAVTVSPDQVPGARRLSALRQKIVDARAVCVFTEPGSGSRRIAALTDGTAVRTGVLDPEGISLKPGPGLYFDLMLFNARNLAACLNGGPEQ